MIDVFLEAMAFTLDKEGSYSNRANDRGGETYYGISRVHHPSWNGWEIIDDIKEDRLSREQFSICLKERVYPKVPSFYKDNFWKPLILDKVNVIAIAIKIFDMGVNLGVPRTVSIVQTCLNVMSLGEINDIKLDNIIGNKTINLINEMTKKDNGELLLKLLTIQQGYFYMRLAQTIISQDENIGGWINRLNMDVKIL